MKPEEVIEYLRDPINKSLEQHDEAVNLSIEALEKQVAKKPERLNAFRSIGKCGGVFDMVIKVIKNEEELEIDITKNIAVQLRMQGYRFMDPFDGLKCQKRIDALHQVRSYLLVDASEQTLVKERKRSEQAQLIAKSILKDALAWVKPLDADGN